MELVEYSPDELRSVDKEMLNAEITQLEGEWFDRLSTRADKQRILVKPSQTSMFSQNTDEGKLNSSIEQETWKMSLHKGMLRRNDMMILEKSGWTNSWPVSRLSVQS